MANIPAFPHVVSNSSDDVYHGISKREYFAAMALQGLVAHGILRDPKDYELTAKVAVRMADELLKQL